MIKDLLYQFQDTQKFKFTQLIELAKRVLKMLHNLIFCFQEFHQNSAMTSFR